MKLCAYDFDPQKSLRASGRHSRRTRRYIKLDRFRPWGGLRPSSGLSRVAESRATVQSALLSDEYYHNGAIPCVYALQIGLQRLEKGCHINR
jgi:hypothetical protein